MPVTMKGGTSGNSDSYLPDVSRPYDNQPVEDTSKTVAYPNVQYTQNTGNREGSHDPPVPNCATSDDANT